MSYSVVTTKPPIITGQRTYLMNRCLEDDVVESLSIAVDIDPYTLNKTYLDFPAEALVVIDEYLDDTDPFTEMKLNWGFFQNSKIPIELLIPIFESLPQRTELELFAALAKNLSTLKTEYKNLIGEDL